jgi:type II secretion system protein N
MSAGKKIALGFGLFGQFMLVFGIAVYFSFPLDSLARWAVSDRMNAALYFKELDSSWFGSIEGKGVRFALLPDDGSEGPLEIYFETLSLDLSLFALISGDIEAEFEGSTRSGGSIQGELRQSSEGIEMDVEFKAVDLAEFPIIRAGTAGLPLFAVVNGDIEISLGPEDESTQGSIVLTLADTTLGPGRIEIPDSAGPMGGQTKEVPRIDLGDLSIQIPIEDGRGKIEKFGNDEKNDASINVDGTIRPFLANGSPDLGLDLSIHLGINQSLQEREPTLAMLAQELSDPRGNISFKVVGRSLSRLKAVQGNRSRTGSRSSFPARPGFGTKP